MRSDDSSLDWARIAEYLFGEMPPDARAAFTDQLARDPALRDAVAMVRRGLRATDVASHAQQVHSATERLERGLLARGGAAGYPTNPATPPSNVVPGPWGARPDEVRAPSVPSRPVVRGRRPLAGLPMASTRRGWRHAVAAGVGAVVMAALIVAGVRVRHRAASSIAAATTYATAHGQVARLTLDDGTRVVLAPGSKLVFTHRAAARIATLDGEAIFTAAHRTDAPFVVRSGATTTRVLGTTFDVFGYATDGAVRVGVLDGRVQTWSRADASAESVLLARGDVVTMSGGVTRRGGSVQSMTAWASGQLVFDGQPLSVALPVLSRWYNLEFVMTSPSLASRRLTTSFPTSGITRDMLDAMITSLEMRYTRVGRTITLYPME